MSKFTVIQPNLNLQVPSWSTAMPTVSYCPGKSLNLNCRCRPGPLEVFRRFRESEEDGQGESLFKKWGGGTKNTEGEWEVRKEGRQPSHSDLRTTGCRVFQEERAWPALLKAAGGQ